MTVSPALRVPGFTVLRPLANGGTSHLLEVREDQSGGRFGLWILRDVPGSATTRVRDALGALRGIQHDNVARLVSVQRTNGNASLLIDLVDGPTLAQCLQDEPFTIAQADDLGRGILAGLAALHAAGVTHPRLGAADILLSVGATGPVPKIVGGGVVAAVSGAAGDVRDDIRAVGMLLHSLLTGHVADPEETLTEIPAEVPERIAQAVLRALRADVDQRAQSVREVLAVWEGSGEESTERIAPARAWDDRAVRRLRRLWSDVTPAEKTWEDLVPEAKPQATPQPSWIPFAVLAGLLGFLAFLGWWGGG